MNEKMSMVAGCDKSYGDIHRKGHALGEGFAVSERAIEVCHSETVTSEESPESSEVETV